MLSHNGKEALRKILLHTFCRFSESEHKDRLNFNAKPFGYFQLTL